MPGDNTQLATFGAGCFWRPEEEFNKISGVVGTVVGYSGGEVEHPTYEQVCGGDTGHAEVVQVEYNPDEISYQELLGVFWRIHDPTQLNRQGPDVGEQYRSVIFYHDDAQKKAAEHYKKALGESNTYKKPITTQILPAKEFYKAEEYHQRYLARRG